VDGWVLVSLAFHHSINYRSVMILGRGHVVGERAEKEAALNALVERNIPGCSVQEFCVGMKYSNNNGLVS
jgi:nitroimidazol reductase NimA-like FMN-containing flavoprotein (pyridoxamine 5'-phosphate oxidase superfamily)